MQIKRLFFIAVACVLCSIASGYCADGWSKNHCKKVKDTADAIKIREQDLQSNPAFRGVIFKTDLCHGETNPDGKTYCVKMNDVELQSVSQAIQIAKNYALERNGDNITCASHYYSCDDRDDHIICATAKRSALYEFVFDNITETRDARYKRGIGLAFCKIFFGDKIDFERKIPTQNDYVNYYISDDTYLNKVAADAIKTQGYYGKNIVVPIESYYSAYRKQFLKLSKKLKENFPFYARDQVSSKQINQKPYSVAIDFKTLQDCPQKIDTRFKSQQINLNLNVVAWLAGYYQRQMTETLNTFKCDLAPFSCKTSDLFNPRDDILKCYANGQPVYFQFDDLSESKETYDRGAQSAMQCMSTDGASFDGTHCRGIGPEECAELGKKLIAAGGTGTKWDNDLDTCTLSDSQKAETMQRNIDRLQNYGLGAVVILVTIGTGGSGTAATVPVIFAIVGTGASIYSEKITDDQRRKANQYLTSLETDCKDKKCVTQCKTDKTCINNCKDEKDCVRSLFNGYFDEIAYYSDSLTDDMLFALDDALSKKIAVFAETEDEQKKFMNTMTQSQNSELYNQCFANPNSKSSCLKNALDMLAAICDFVSLGSSAFKFANTKAVKSISSFEKTRGAFLNIGKRLHKSVDNLEATNYIVHYTNSSSGQGSDSNKKTSSK